MRSAASRELKEVPDRTISGKLPLDNRATKNLSISRHSSLVDILALVTTQQSMQIDIHASPDDADEAISVMHRAFEEYSLKGQESGAMRETSESLRKEMADEVELLIARLDGDPVAMCKYLRAEATIYFSRLAVIPELRGKGIASEIVRALRSEALVRDLQGLSCCVRADEAGNIALYEQLAMKVVSRQTRGSLTGATLNVLNMRGVAVMKALGQP